MTGLYVHVPFCVRRCEYCDFATGPYEGGLADRYLEALELELARLSRRPRPRTVFVGGGTPTALSPAQLGRLFDLLHRRTDLDRVVEWTLEANPDSLDGERLSLARRHGVTRVSVGVQSFHPAALAFLGRLHDAGQAERAVRSVMDAGLAASLDLIYGVPGQDEAVWEADLARALALDPGHVSAYCLAWEPDTPLAARRDRGEAGPQGEEAEEALYRMACSVLGAAGYRRYEVSNFARPGRDCLHNRTYWENGEWVGVGNGAASHEGGERRSNHRGVGRYIEAVLSGEDPVAFRESLEGRRRAGEALVLGLRLEEGVEAGRFREATGVDLLEAFGEPIRRFQGLGLLEWDGERLRLAGRAWFVSDAVFAELV